MHYTYYLPLCTVRLRVRLARTHDFQRVNIALLRVAVMHGFGCLTQSMWGVYS